MKTTRSTTAVGSGADAATSRTVPGADVAAPGTTGGPLPGASENTREGSAIGEAGGPVRDLAVNGPATPSRDGDAAAAAASELRAGRPQGAALAAEAAAGSATQAPSVGSGPVSDLDEAAIRLYFARPQNHGILASLAEHYGFVVGGPAVAVENAAGVAPALMSREGALGSVSEYGQDAFLDRIGAIEGVSLERRRGAKLAEPLPQDRTNVAELIEQGFDLIVTSSQDGFRRAGVAHPKSPTLRRSTDFTIDELKALSECPMLVIQPLR